MSEFHRLLAIVVFPMFASLSCGRELLVDQTKPAAPYRTLADAARDAKPGDTIRIAKDTGPYRETLYIKQSGTPDAPITVEGEGNVITGFEPLRFRQDENGVWVGAAPTTVSGAIIIY